MSDPKFTTEPLTIMRDYIGYSIVMQKDGYPIARADSQHDAHLIVAAPELYVALEAMLNEYEGVYDEVGAGGRPYQSNLAKAAEQLAIAALKKARGEA